MKSSLWRDIQHSDVATVLHASEHIGHTAISPVAEGLHPPHRRALRVEVIPLRGVTHKTGAFPRSKCLTDSVRRWLRTGLSFFSMSHRVRCTASTGRARRPRRGFSELVAPGNDGLRARSIRRNQGFLRDRPNGRSESDHGAAPPDAGRQRSNCPLERRFIAAGEVAQAWHARDLPRFPSRDDDHSCRRDPC
jgi:hypothetical protein